MRALGLIRATEPISSPRLLAGQAAPGAMTARFVSSASRARALISCLPPSQACAGLGLRALGVGGGWTRCCRGIDFISHGQSRVRRAEGKHRGAVGRQVSCWVLLGPAGSYWVLLGCHRDPPGEQPRPSLAEPGARDLPPAPVPAVPGSPGRRWSPVPCPAGWRREGLMNSIKPCASVPKEGGRV